MQLTRPLILLVVTGVLFQKGAADDDAPSPVDFGRDVRPILSDVCFTCHGPDEAQRVSSLRLDLRDGVFENSSDGPIVVPGKPNESRLFQRITSHDADVRMPPPDSGRTLSDRQIELLEEWIRQGASWEEHWSFTPVARPPVPEPTGADWVQNPIDAFVLARLEKAGLSPSPDASRKTLIRRASLGLTGLPATPEQTEAFVDDSSDDAWERVIDRLLQSEHYGERMAVDWLDAARYADTSGYQNDGPRDMWRWRDWVINAFNAGMPFDQFTIEQLAGDLLPDPTLSQRIATGFNRNHRGNAEGGIIPEEYQVEYVVDRVDTTATVWLGLTMGCGRCHDHKYDPISQKEYYQVFAYFNNIPESGRAIKEGNSPPYIQAPTAEQQRELASLDAKIAEAEQLVRQSAAELQAGIATWEASAPTDVDAGWTVADGMIHCFALDGSLADSANEQTAAGFDGGTLPFVSSRHGEAVAFDGTAHIDGGDVAEFGYFDKFSICAWIRPTAPTGTIVSRMVPVEHGAGYAVHLEDGYLQVNLVKRWLDDSIRVQSADRLDLGEWRHLCVTYDGSRVADGITVYLDGEAADLDVKLDGINQSFATTEPLRIGGGQSAFVGEIDDVRIYQRVLSPLEAAIVAVPESIVEILDVASNRRTAAQAAKLSDYYLRNHSSKAILAAHQKLADLRQLRQNLSASVPTVMVMQEMPRPRQTHLLLRGQYDAPGEPVTAGVPSVFPPPADDQPNNRLGFARWLVSDEHPLTARVTVNRIWQMHFGTGLVKTTEDFGSQGDRPSHPQLLDWLAREFVEGGWNVKTLHKLILTSATYRQTSRCSEELLKRDPENRLLARGPRFRLSAETIRDQALFVSGLLTPTIGGPSVRPYQPEGLWKEIASTTDYEQSHGEDLYRRSLYTYWKRTVAPPTMATLDATSREACIVKRSRTNTPLQALALMNEVTFVEAARVLAQRLSTDASTDGEERIRDAFLLATSRRPRPEELRVLLEAYARYLERFRDDTSAAKRLIAVGEYPLAEGRDAAELAALATVCSLILNLDEVLNSE